MNRIYTLFVTLIVLLFVTSCQGKEQPLAPIETNDIAKVEVVVIEGHLHGKYGFHETADPAGQVYMKRFSKFVYQKQSDGSMSPTPDSSSKLFAVGGGSHTEGQSAQHLNAVYGFWIDYFDDKGTKITEKVLGGDHKMRVQHFFIARNITPTFDGDQKLIEAHKSQAKFMDYIYCDTDPLTARIKDGAKVIGETTPIGHKGYLGFFVPRSQFTLDIVLSDVGSKSVVRPFYDHPTNTKAIIKLSIPVVVYADASEYSENEEMDELTDADRRYLESVANAFGITIEQALQAYLNRLYGDVPPHSDAGYWF